MVDRRDHRSTSVKEYAIPDEACRRAGIVAKWAAHDRLAIYGYKHVTYNNRDQISEFAPLDAKVHHVRFNSMLFDPCMRKLVNESCGTFLAGQKLAQRMDDGGDHRQDLLKLSRQYRSIVRVCLDNLQELANNSTPDKAEQYRCFVAVLYNIELVWHLCEILYVDFVPGDVILPQLVEWIRFHFPQVERRAAAIIKAGTERIEKGLDSTGAESESDYWETVIGVLLQGRVDATRALLVLHSAAATGPFQMANSCLRSMPIYNVYGGMTSTGFNGQWQRWQADVRAKVEDGNFASHKYLELIMKIVAGDLSVLDQIRGYCERWYQLMTAVLFFTEPTVKSFDLSYHANQAMTRFCQSNILRNLDSLILALLESNLHEVIQELQNTAENGWFAAHLTNLLFLCGRLNILDTNQVNVAHQLHEHVLLDYGTTLMAHPSLWQVGVSYLDHCPPQGIARLELLLPAIPLSSETRALKVIHIAQERGLNSVVSSICKVMANQSLRRQRLGNALTWALRSQDANFTAYLADRFLALYSDKGEFESTDLLDNLGSCMLVSDRLTFLGKYCEFHQLYRSGNLRAAGSLLVSLLASNLPPKSFQLTLLVHSLPLLEAAELILSSNDTYILMSCLEELESDHLSQLNIPNGGNSIATDRQEQVKLIRLSLSRNLSRAIIVEGSDIPEIGSRTVICNLTGN